MLFYIGLMFLLLVLAFLENKKVVYRTRHYCFTNKQIISGCALLLVLFMAILRSKNVGGDLINYERTFQYWRTLSFSELFRIKNSDLGFVLFNWGIGKIFPSVYALMIGQACIVLGLVFIVLKKYSFNISFSLFLFLCIGRLGGLLSGIRQELAIAVLFCSISYIEQKKWKEFLISCILAASFHSTAIVGAIMYWFGYKKYDRGLFFKYILFGIGVILLTVIGIPFIVSLYNVNDYSQLIVNGTGINLLLFRSAILFLCIILLKVNGESSKENLLFVKIYSIGCIIQILAIGFSLLTRLTTYFCVIIVILLPNIVMGMKSKPIKYISFAIMTLGAIFYFIFISKEDTAGIFPYEFFWQV